MKALLSLFLVVLTSCVYIPSAWTQTAPVLWYQQPAKNLLNEGLPIGNGRLGALVAGGVENERLAFNEDSLWMGGANPDGGYDLKKFGAYQAFGDLLIAFDAPSTSVTDYRRELDLKTAVARTSFTRAGVTHTREAFVSHPAQTLVWHWSADKVGAVAGVVKLKGTHGESTLANNNTLTFGGTLDNGLQYEARARVLARGGTVGVLADGLQLKGCDEVTLLLVAGTNYAMNFANGYRGTMPDLQKQLDAAAKQNFAAIKSAHEKDFSALFGRVQLDLGTSSEAQRSLPTDKRKLEAAKTTDPELEATLFQYGRYLTISSSRRPGLPANLQGLWNISNDPPWRSDYHANINVQMNYWPVEVANLSETALPFFDLVQSQLPAWRKVTQSSDHWQTPSGALSFRGWALRTSHNTMGGLGWEWDETANAWYALHFWEHYAFTQDKEYLKTVAYPLLKETSEFWQDHLKTLPDGRLVVPNGWSPEHGPREDGVSYNQQIVWDLFTNTIEAAKALGVDKEYSAQIAALREKLVAPQIGKWGQLQEWMTDRDDPSDHHRHTSHLFAVFPGRQISVAKTPELAQAAKVSLDARGIDAGSDVREWSFAWRCALYARLHDGEQAHSMVQNLLAARNTCPNLFGLHPPMQIDGNFGITAGIAEMLLQSHEGEIVLLPALPKAWPNGRVLGLRARGGFEVDITWQNGQLQNATIRSEKGGTVPVRSGDRTAKINLKERQSVRLNGDLVLKQSSA
jgi:alpha-L-fucosidase 2